jgi:hypothetical protein
LIYVLLRFLEKNTGKLFNYTQWKDSDGNGAVTFGGIAFYETKLSSTMRFSVELPSQGGQAFSSFPARLNSLNFDQGTKPI